MSDVQYNGEILWGGQDWGRSTVLGEEYSTGGRRKEKGEGTKTTTTTTTDGDESTEDVFAGDARLLYHQP